jgi:hypothetical protein
MYEPDNLTGRKHKKKAFPESENSGRTGDGLQATSGEWFNP